MSEIPLRTYIEQIDSQVERKQVDEAIAHCRHILSFYPKHLDTYRMLGKALLEKGRHGDAADIFQRVLSARPDDFIAHVGLAIVREDEANLEAALWHMERAFESAPSNGAIQQELCRLYGRRDGVVPQRARLTRGALARMYAQGGLFLQAEAELKAALRDEADRMDLLTTLAEVHWSLGRAADAAETCSKILQTLPYNQQANRILFEIYRAEGRAEEAAAFRQRLETLDPYEAFAAPDTGLGAADVEAGKVKVQRLEYVPGMESGGSPDWIAAIGARFEDTESRPDSETTPDWLDAGPESPATEAAAAFASAPGQSELPDWLQEPQPTVNPQITAPDIASEAPDWLSELKSDAAASASMPSGDDLPDWLKVDNASDPDETMPGWISGSAVETMTQASLPAPDETLPGWLREAAGADQPGASAAAPEAHPAVPVEAEATISVPAAPEPGAEDEIPDWLKSATGDPSEEADELPAWLQSLQPAAEPGGAAEPDNPQSAPWLTARGEATEPAATSPASAGDPEWLAGMETAAEGAPEWLSQSPTEHGAESVAHELSGPTPGQAPDASAAPAAEDEVPDWLASATADDTLEPGELPDWLRSAAPAAAEPAEAEPVAEAEADLEAAVLPDWLRSLQPEATREPQSFEQVVADTPDELLPAASDDVDATQIIPAVADDQPTLHSLPAAELPGWLQSIQPPEELEAETPETDDTLLAFEMPDWLKAAAASAPPPDVPQASLPPSMPEPEAEVPSPAVPPVELPDFLQLASPEAIARAEQPLELEEEPDAEEAGADEIAVPAEIPDWLMALAPEGADSLEAPESPPADLKPLEEVVAGLGADLPDWLAETTAEPAPAADLFGEDEAVPDWLQASADLPPWAQPQQPGPTDTVVNWLAGKDVPEWLNRVRAEAAEGGQLNAADAMPPAGLGEQTAETPPTPPVEPSAVEDVPVSTASETDLAAMTPEEAFRWLEGLAAQQGASQEELLSQDQAQPASASEVADDAPLTAEWLSQVEAGMAIDPLADTAPRARTKPAEEPAELAEDEEVIVPVEAPVSEVEPSAIAESAGPGLADMSPEEALAWLEGLAVRQGADPAELLTTVPTEDAPQVPAEATEAERSAAADDTVELLELDAAEAAGVEEPAAPAPDMTALDDDDALRWLESLAARQGAKAEELLTAPAEGAVEAPEWISAEVESNALQEPASPEPELQAPGAVAEIEADATLEPAADLSAETELPEVEITLAPAQPIEGAAEPAALEADEALRWLESLAERQGVSADELLTAPEVRHAETPEWVRAEAEALASNAPAPPEIEAEVIVPEAPVEPPSIEEPMLAIPGADSTALDEAASDEPPAEAATAPGVAETPPNTPTADVDKLSRLADRLAAARRAKEAEIEARFAAQRAQQEEARRQVQARLETGRLFLRARAESAEDDAPQVAPEKPESAAPTATETSAAPRPEPQPMPLVTASTDRESGRPPRRPWNRRAPMSPSPFDGQPASEVLSQARDHLASGELTTAAGAFEHLVESEQAVNEVIAALTGVAGPLPTSLLRILGDAYMKTDRLQKALDTYREALNRL